MDSIIKFKEAAKELQNDERYLALVAAQKANDEDEALQSKIGEFNLLRLDVNNEMAKEDKDEEKIAQMNQKVGNLYNEIMASESMQAYNKAKEGIESFMGYVNAILNAAIDGKDPMQVQEPSAGGCPSGGCSSCGGSCG